MMTSTNLNDHFLAIWRRALNQPSLDSLSPSLIQSWAMARGLNVISVVEKDVGAFAKTKSIVLTIEGGQACFPKISASGDPAWELNRKRRETRASLWEKLEWFEPLWIPMINTGNLLKDAENCSKERGLELFNYHTSTIYTLAFQAVCIEQLIPKAHSLKEFSPLIREAYLAFYSGYRASSIAALIPAIEGALTKIVAGAGAELKMPEKISRAIQAPIERAARLHFEKMWVPKEYLTTEYLFGQDERVFVFETFRRWLQNSFFCDTDNYDGVTWLNRHLFAHGTSVSWQQSSNFSRLIIALATMGLIESWYDESDRVLLFFPEMSEDSKLLWQQALFNGQAQFVLKGIEEKRYHDHGRLVPELPTDDGVLLRKAKLAEDCINDLVRPLRKAGWSVAVGESDEKALHMSVVATSGDEKFGVTLLYSCATGNETYKNLAKTSKVILYRGAPYHQEQFAYGLEIHVGPVTGWQPPLAPNRKAPTRLLDFFLRRNC